jgi:integrase/recombinase XerD
MYISMRASSTLLSRRRYRSKGRYYEATKRFCAYLATYYHLQKLENVSGKHLVSYVLYLQE